MKVTLVWCQDAAKGIAKNGMIPWHIKSELAHFVSVTKNQIVVMGRKTYESIGHPLKNRTNVVLTTNHNWKAEGVKVYDNLEQLLIDFKNDHIYVIGGQKVYEQFIDFADELIISKLSKKYDCDQFLDFDLNAFLLKSNSKQPEFEVDYYVRKN